MSAATTTNLLEHFLRMEERLEKEPETVQAEIVRGVYLMSPRPRPRHGGAQVGLAAELRRRLGAGEAGRPPDWLFVVEPEIRSEKAFSRLVPDLAGWRRSTGGWPDLDQTPVTLVPEWVAEILSPGTAATDRNEKSDAYGSMGVGWLWLVDPDRRAVETYANVRGRMTAGPVFRAKEEITGEPFGSVSIPVEDIFVRES
jgi:Uma2 family endonuclease